jgi:hypothetical protein
VIVRTAFHLALHALVPCAIAWFFFRNEWRRAVLIMLATMAVDLDHLLASPVFDPDRCSIGFHPLHTWPAIFVYALATLPRATRLVGIGLLVHMALDWSDCMLASH